MQEVIHGLPRVPYLSTDSIVPHNIYLPPNRVKRVRGPPLSFVLWQRSVKNLQSTRPKNRLRWEMYETTFWGLPIYRHSRSGVYCLCPRIDRKGQGPRPPNPQGLRGPNREPTKMIIPYYSLVACYQRSSFLDVIASLASTLVSPLICWSPALSAFHSVECWCLWTHMERS